MQQAYDLFLFIGQSNIAGRGVSSPRWPEGAPELTPGAGFEYRSVSAPEQLFPIQEPFGAAENDPNGIFEPGMKTGSLVTAFVNAYYAQTHTPIIGVSASKGGSAISAWQGQNDYLSDAFARLQRAQCYMQQHCSIFCRYTGAGVPRSPSVSPWHHRAKQCRRGRPCCCI